ncbi:LamB/YcsF family protein [Micrococcus luteus]|nr:LamB/YcsF family protein [Micrococcus luteus]MCV7719852.1 LamB/YcsF family protein [Micrococcus luteus]MCV7722054.1 LamB/YcsF family protein [Micrococcus luteus]MCV7734476.1 LamB/YcsF family protein [Micrococcus luteus]TKD54645.1 lactam utilization protein LamB [Micrococcus luteus]
MGEALGLHSFGHDEALMSLIDVANVACGFHAGDPSVMDKTVALALRHDVRVGAHPGLPDISGFGRRRIALTSDEVREIVLYQVAALTGFLRRHGGELNHIKPHGALYGMLAGDEHLMGAAADVAELYGVPVYGLAGTSHEKVCQDRGIEFVPELYVDLNYDAAGQLIIKRTPHQTDPADAARRVELALTGQPFPSIEDEPVTIPFASICVHSDTPNAPAVARAVREAIGHAVEA